MFRKFLVFFFCVSLSFLSCCGKNTPKRGEVLRIAFDPKWQLIELLGEENRVSGFIEELFLEIAKKSEVNFELIKNGSETLFLNLEKGEVDGVISNRYPYIFYQEKYKFSSPFLLTGPVLIVNIDSKYKSLSEMSDKLIGVEQNNMALFLFQKYPKVLVRTYDIPPNLLDEVTQRNIDGALLNNLLAFAYIRDLYSQQLKMTSPLTDEGLRVIALKNKKEIVVDFFENVVKKLEKDGTITKLKHKWRIG